MKKASLLLLIGSCWMPVHAQLWQDALFRRGEVEMVQDSVSVSDGLQPVLNLSAGIRNAENSRFTSDDQLGLTFQHRRERFRLLAGAVMQYSRGMDHYRLRKDAFPAFFGPTWDRPESDHAWLAWMPVLQGQYRPHKHIALEAGYGKHHLGYGLRSPFMDRWAVSRPYFLGKADWGPLSYQFYLAGGQHRGGLTPTDRRLKWWVTHTVEYHRGWFRAFVFESVAWQHRDGRSYRGIDLHYLNPAIVFRPVEFNNGSSDNVLLGGGIRLDFWGVEWYGQFLLDEFLLDEIRAGNGWWANKFALNGGLLRRGRLWGGACVLRAEVSLARPFTYSHSNAVQSYTLQGVPLAHPMGSNFAEGLVGFDLQQDVWQTSLWLRGSVFGGNTAENLGSDPRVGNGTRTREYGHHLAQGNRTWQWDGHFRLSRKLFPEGEWQIWAEAGMVYRTREVKQQNGSVVVSIANRHETTPFFSAGIRTRIFADGTAPF